MHHSKTKSGQIVAPGDRLGVIEEFTSGPGTYEENGTIYSNITGCALLDIPDKRVSVCPSIRAVRIPQVGGIVIGQVSDAQSKMAMLRIFRVGKKPISGFFTGILHISDVSPGYVETMFDVCKTGDIMRAKVVSDKNRTYHLSIVEKNLGVIYAFCSRCGHTLAFRKRRMQCSKCGKIERRKTASYYGKELYGEGNES